MREKFWVNPEFEEMLAQAGFKACSDFMTLGEVVRTTGNKQNVRARAGPGPNGPRIFLKRFSPDRAGLGFRELENTRLVESLGIRVPVPVAAGVCEAGSFFASAEICGGVPLDDWLKLRSCAEGTMARQERNKLIRSVAEIANKLHSAGYCHRDLYLCHFFLAPDDGLTLHLIDLQRVRRASPFKMRWMVKDMAALNYSAAAEFCTMTDRLRFLRYYLQVGKLGGKARRLAARVARKTARISRHESGKARTGACRERAL